MISEYKGISPKIGNNVYIADSAHIIGDVVIGNNSSIWDNVVIRGDVQRITIGESSNIQELCSLHCGKDELVIGNNVTVGHGAILHSCVIGDYALIGMGSILLDGTHIGNGCMIGAGSLVSPRTNIEENMLAFGSPASPRRPVTPTEHANMQENINEYLRLSMEYHAAQQQKTEHTF